MSKMFHTIADLTDLDSIIKSNKERLKLLNIIPKELKNEIQIQTDPPIQQLPKQDSLKQLNNSIQKYIQSVDKFNQQHQQNLEELITKIKSTVKRVLNLDAHVYGSYATGLSLPNSDIDIVIMTSQTLYIVDQMKKLENEFIKCKFIEEAKCILFAAIPVLKLKSTAAYHNKKLDISFQEPRHNGIQCVTLIKDYLRYLPELRPLTMVIKQFLSYSNLLDPYQGGLSSYALNLMIICFLQTKASAQEAQITLAQLLIEFLYLYGCEMDYISKTIYVFPPNQQINAYPIYFNPQNAINQIPTLLIQDPINEKHNVGRPSYNIQNIKFIFAVGFMKALEYQSDTIDEFLYCGQHVQLKLQSHVQNLYQQ